MPSRHLERGCHKEGNFGIFLLRTLASIHNIAMYETTGNRIFTLRVVENSKQEPQTATLSKVPHHLDHH
jgi:hypothetical protein